MMEGGQGEEVSIDDNAKNDEEEYAQVLRDDIGSSSPCNEGEKSEEAACLHRVRY